MLRWTTDAGRFVFQRPETVLLHPTNRMVLTTPRGYLRHRGEAVGTRRSGSWAGVYQLSAWRVKTLQQREPQAGKLSWGSTLMTYCVALNLASRPKGAATTLV